MSSLTLSLSHTYTHTLSQKCLYMKQKDKVIVAGSTKVLRGWRINVCCLLSEDHTPLPWLISLQNAECCTLHSNKKSFTIIYYHSLLLFCSLDQHVCLFISLPPLLFFPIPSMVCQHHWPITSLLTAFWFFFSDDLTSTNVFILFS